MNQTQTDLLKLLESDNTPTNKETIKCNGKELPVPVALSEVWNTKIEREPEVIEKVLRKGHKMILTAPSKAGKTFCMMELAAAIASGEKWLGFQCSRGKVLYVNFELTPESCNERFIKIGNALKLKPQDRENIIIWNLRGHTVPFQILSPNLTMLVNAYQIDLVILDPIYKCFSGSENDQEAVTDFCNSIDTIADAGASVVYTHHHSKGIQGNKSSMDRGSGSGVFARDADAILDLIQIFNAGDASIDPEDATVTAWQLEGVLREFAPFKPKRVYFRYPLHLVDDSGTLDGARPRTKQQVGAITRRAQIEAETIRKQKAFEKAFSELSATGAPVTKRALAEKLNCTEKTISNQAARFAYSIVKGKVYKMENMENR